jgi:hypothetical protein
MNDAQARAEEMLRQMAATRALPEPAERAVVRRERVIQTLGELQSTLVERRQRIRRWQRRVAWLAVAAMPALGVGGGWYVHARHTNVAHGSQPAAANLHLEVAEGTVSVTHGGRLDTIAAPGSLGLDSCEELATRADGRAAMVLDSGARLEVLPKTQLGITASAENRGEKIELRSGQVDIAVPKLGPGHALSVHTPDTTVEVHGTKFSVAVTSVLSTPVTRVVVAEGRVLVRHGPVQLYLLAGSTWSSRSVGSGTRTEAHAAVDSDPGAGTSPPETTGDRAGSLVATAGTAVGSNRGTATSDDPAMPRGSSPAAAKAASDLADQNWLFQQAMQARRAGNDARALTLLDQLFARYPHTLLAQEARVERFRALGRLGRKDEASREARRYLAEHPGGFATDEARSLALDASPMRREN